MAPRSLGKRQGEDASLSVLRLPTRESGDVERIRKELARQEGVSSVQVDLLRGIIVVEYNPNKIELDEIRALVRFDRLEK